ncbi:MAG: BlaI/MecI/CopY family transcriptional regulator [Planctomycetota bacterium]
MKSTHFLPVRSSLSESSHTLDLDFRQICRYARASLHGSATAKQIVDEIPDSPSRTAIRTMLSILVEKKMLKFKKVGREYVYSPTRSKEKAGRGALQSLLNTFFGGSIEDLIATHFSDPESAVDEQSLKRLERMIRDARKSEKQK